MRPARSLQGRLLGLVLVGVLAVWAAVSAATWLDVRHELDELLDAHLAQAATLLVARQVHEIDDDDAAIDAPSLHRYAPKVAFQVFHEGRLALRSANAPADPMVAFEEDFREGFRSVRLGGQDWRVFATHGGERDVQVYVGEARESRLSILWAVLRGTLWPMALALPLLAVAIWWSVRRGLQPLRLLGQQLSARSPQDLQAVTLAEMPAEMAPMLDALNHLFGRIAGLMESERRFTADAAHELRTPIAAIRTQAQVALAEADDARRRHALQATLAGCDRATRLVEQLLTLARLEAGTLHATQPVDLGALAQRVLAELAPAALARQQELSLDAEPGCRVRGEDTLLAVLLRNLVDNALRYSPDAARIVVSLRREGAGIRLTVADSGPGLDATARARLGERFFRVLDVSQGQAQSGSGLGWSIVRRIADAHQAGIALQSSPALGGLEVRVDFVPA